MRTILIAPNHPDLAMLQDEIESVVTHLEAHPVLGYVDVARFYRELAGGRWELIWIASHGNEDGIQLSDSTIDGDTMAGALRGTQARLIMLNTCSSERAAEQIYSATSIPVVCNVGPVPDVAAYATARRFAEEISRGHDVARAYALARTRTFRLIPDSISMYSQGPNNDLEDIRRDVAEIRSVQRDHHDILYGRPGQDGLVHVLSVLASRMAELRAVLWVIILLFAGTLATLAVIVNLIWQSLP